MKIYKKSIRILILFISIILYSCQPNSCGNGIQDNDEIGIDCGGNNCPPCNSTCTNGVQDGDETGVDCGGANCLPCNSPCSGVGVFIGDVTLSSQVQIDSFGSFNYKSIVGNLEIGKGIFDYVHPSMSNESDIYDLESLCSLTKINGSLFIKNNPSLTNLNGLSNIDTITNKILIVGNAIVNLNEFSNLTSVKSIFISSETIVNLNGFNNLNSLVNLEFLGVNYNSLYGLTGLINIDSNLIFGPHIFSPNTDSLSLNILTNLSSVGNKCTLAYLQYKTISNIGNLSTTGRLILSSTALENLNTFSNITQITNEINIEGNNSLNDYCGIQNIVTTFSGVYNNAGNNLYNPTLQDLINGDCTP